MSKELMQKRIARAQAEIDAKKEIVAQGKMRQRYHFMGQTGWINDANGLIYYKGKYHFFYQYNPYYGFWDYMHWGHAISDDMLHWEYLPLALAPSEGYDDHMRGGCFSGSAIEHDGKLFLMYTGVINEGRGFEQAQCVAWSEDGIHFEKYEGNPVLTAPENVPAHQFRDPKVWKHEDMYYMVCGASREMLCGAGTISCAQALLYRSPDMLHWEYVNVLAESRGEYGYMWECPDLYPLGDKYVLTVSPMGAGERTVIWFVGDFDYETGSFYPETTGEADWGYDFYAPQSFPAPDGRRIAVAWANNWDWMPFWKDWGPAWKEGWCGFYNIPREVELSDDGRLKFIPMRETQTLRDAGKKTDCVKVGEEPVSVKAGDGISYEWKMKIDLAATTAEKLEIALRAGEGKQLLCTLDFAHVRMSVDRTNADGWSAGISHSAMKLKGKKELDIHIFSDQSSVEIFTDDYRNNHSMNVYAGNEQDGIRLQSYGGETVLRDMEIYGLTLS